MLSDSTNPSGTVPHCTCGRAIVMTQYGWRHYAYPTDHVIAERK